MKGFKFLRENIREISIFLGVIIAISSIAFTVISFIKEPKSNLGLYFNASHYYFPKEFASRLNDQWRIFSYENSSNDLDGFLDKNSQNQQYIDTTIVDLFRKYLDQKSKQLYTVPLENNPSIFNSVFHIQIKNHGKKTAHKISIKLPAKGFIEINTNSGESIPASISSELLIPEILGNKFIDVWVYFKDDLDNLDLSKLTIVHDDVLVDFIRHKHFSGLSAFFAKYGFIIFMLLITILGASFYYIKQNVSKQ